MRSARSRPTSATARQASPSSRPDPTFSSSPTPSVARQESQNMRPSTSSKALNGSGSAYSLRLEQGLGSVRGNKSTNSMSSEPEDASSVHSQQFLTSEFRDHHIRSIDPALRVSTSNKLFEPATPTVQPSQLSPTYSIMHTTSTDSNTTAVSILAPEVVVNSNGGERHSHPLPRDPISPKGAGATTGEVLLVPSPSLSRPRLNEFALFNEEIRARATASREGSRAYLQNSVQNASTHGPDASSPLKQRRVSLTKSSSGIPANGTLHSAIHNAGPGSVRSLSKQDLLEQVHKALFAPVSSGSISPTPGRGSPSDPLQPQVAAHPSFSQPISPTSSIQQQQSRAFGHNTAVVKATASGKIIQYGNPSVHPGNRYAK